LKYSYGALWLNKAPFIIFPLMKKISITLIFFLLQTINLSAQQKYYVHAGATGQADGSSWVNAFTTLNPAFEAVQAGDTVWVAAGTYYPTAGTDRDISLTLKKGVYYYGGFSGTETHETDRNPDLYRSIISGDIGVPQQRIDNSRLLVAGYGLNASGRFDGFELREAEAYGEIETRGGAMLLECGGSEETGVTIANCTFVRNRAYNGAGLYVDGGAYLVNYPRLEGCRFEENRASNFGGGAYLACAGEYADTLLIKDCHFERNWGFLAGGGLILDRASHTICHITDCAFKADTTRLNGGGLCFVSSSNIIDSNTLEVRHSVFEGNLASIGASILFDGYTYVDPVTSPQFHAFRLKVFGSLFQGNVARNNQGPSAEGSVLRTASEQKNLYIEFDSCLIQNNSSAVGAIFMGQILNTNDSPYSGTMLINRCRIVNNKNLYSNNHHYALYGASFRNQSITIKNSLFANNGGAVRQLKLPDSKCSLNIENSTFYSNGDKVFSRSHHIGVSQFNSELKARNCIIWEPQATLPGLFDNNKTINSITFYGVDIDDSYISYTANQIYGAGSFPFNFGNNMYYSDQYSPEFVNEDNGDFRLSPCSPLVNRGNNNFVGLLDLDGQARIAFDTVDLGAYEQSVSCESTGSSSVDGTPKLAVQCFPNPAIETLHIAVSAATTGLKQAQLYDVHGRLQHTATWSTEATALSVAQLPAGVYRLQVWAGAQLLGVESVVVLR
jgi:Secretion system C-terminal sorting domain